MDNFLYIPKSNPVKFFETNLQQLPKYFTKHLEKYSFKDRLYDWQEQVNFCQIWQKEDIINLQFSSNYAPIIVSLLNEYGEEVVSLPALIGLPNKYISNTFIYQASISLATIPQGCYYIKIVSGLVSPTQKVLISDKQFVSDTQIENSLLFEYYNHRFLHDVLYETNIKFQYRVFGAIGFLDPVRNDEKAKDQRYNPILLNSRLSEQFELFIGGNYGVADDTIVLLNHIWSCSNVFIDEKSFALVSNFEFVTIENYPKRGVKLKIEEGINRSSMIYSTPQDPNKKLITTVIVDARIFGDTANQGSNNVIPVFNIVQE